MITIDDFGKVEMRVGLVTEAINVENSEKLIRLTVNLGDEQRIVFTGVRKWYAPEYFVNKKFVFVTNLEPKKMLEEESQGMIVAVGEEKPVFLIPEDDVEVGARVR